MSARRVAGVAIVFALLGTSLVLPPEGLASRATVVAHDHGDARHRFRLSAGTTGVFTTLSEAGKDGYEGRGFAYYPSGKRVPKAARRKAPTATLSRTGQSAIEPTLGVDSKGRGFLIATHADQWPNLPSDTVRSSDMGETWDIVTPTLGGNRLHRTSTDPYLHLDEDTDRVFMADYLPPCTDFSFTDDGGESWTNVPSPCGLGDHQTMFTGPPTTSQTVGYPNVVYYCAIDGFTVAGAAASCIKSVNGGLSFVRTGTSPFSDPGPRGPGFVFEGTCLGLIGHGTSGPDGTVYVPRVWCGQPFLAISRDEGLTWERVQISKLGAASGGSNLDHDSAVATDDKGNVFYAWAGPEGQPYLSVSRDGGKSWSDPVDVQPPGVKTATLLALDADAKGRVALAFLGSATKGYDAPGGWHGYIVATDRGLDEDPLFYGARVNPVNDPLEGICDTSTCRAGREFIDVAISPDGSVWAPFVDACFDGKCDEGGHDYYVAFTPAYGEAVVGILTGTPFGRR